MAYPFGGTALDAVRFPECLPMMRSLRLRDSGAVAPSATGWPERLPILSRIMSKGRIRSAREDPFALLELKRGVNRSIGAILLCQARLRQAGSNSPNISA